MGRGAGSRGGGVGLLGVGIVVIVAWYWRGWPGSFVVISPRRRLVFIGRRVSRRSVIVIGRRSAVGLVRRIWIIIGIAIARWVAIVRPAVAALDVVALHPMPFRDGHALDHGTLYHRYGNTLDHGTLYHRYGNTLDHRAFNDGSVSPRAAAAAAVAAFIIVVGPVIVIIAWVVAIVRTVDVIRKIGAECGLDRGQGAEQGSRHYYRDVADMRRFTRVADSKYSHDGLSCSPAFFDGELTKSKRSK
jgi:hypothetical protein